MEYFNPQPKPVKKTKEPYNGIKKTYNKTGELELFHKIFEKRGGICCITKEPLDFHVECFAHILSKGAYPSYRLLEWNIVLVQRRIHKLYDNSGREELLVEFPKAIILYELKDELKSRYVDYAANLKFNKQP